MNLNQGIIWQPGIIIIIVGNQAHQLAYYRAAAPSSISFSLACCLKLTVGGALHHRYSRCVLVALFGFSRVRMRDTLWQRTRGAYAGHVVATDKWSICWTRGGFSRVRMRVAARATSDDHFAFAASVATTCPTAQDAARSVRVIAGASKCLGAGSFLPCWPLKPTACAEP